MATFYPNNFDSDLSIAHIEDNITEIGGDAINALRDAVFAIEETLGLNPQGTAGDLLSRLAVSIDPDGHLNHAELTSHGLITLPITAAMMSDSSIPEIKLVLDHSTASLYASIQSLTSNLASFFADYVSLLSHYNEHIYGVSTDGYLNRHVASHIDINDGTNNGGTTKYVGIDKRDLLYYNTGLIDKTGNIRNAATVMAALIQINSDFILHALSLDGYHPASFITLDVTGYTTFPQTITTVQEGFDYLDTIQTVIVEEHQGTMHCTGIPKHHNVTGLAVDGYNQYWGPFACQTRNLANGRNYVIFDPAIGFPLDWAFKQIKAGDHIRINYGGFEATFPIELITYTVSTTFEIEIDGYNIIETDYANAILEKANFDDNHYGILAAAASNHNYYFGVRRAGFDTSLGYVPGSAIVVQPNCASATGIDLCLDDLDSTHYKLYVGFYPNANPASGLALTPTTRIREIDVTGNAGATPGTYTLQGVINNVNRAFREGGYNYRMVAFDYKGQFGLAITDTIDNPGFSIIYGVSDTSQGPYTNNVVDIINNKDALGLGPLKAAVASPLYSSSINSPTKVFVGRKHKRYNANGQFIDYVANGYDTNSESYYDAMFINTDNFGGVLRERGFFRAYKDLTGTNMYPGSTITIHPYSVDDYTAKENFYGRFVVESVECLCTGYTDICVVDCCSWNGTPVAAIATPTLADPTSWVPVKLYFSEDSVVFQNYGSFKDYYEINAKRNGNTFAHRRAAIPLQALSPTLLDTTIGVDYSYLPTADVVNFGWHVVDVSPKLRGFVAVGPAINQRYVRFVVSDFSATDNSYSGYICQPNGGSLITNVGQSIRVKVGEVGRYYDNTGVDYIDILFDYDPVNLPFTAPIAAGLTRYVDILIFESIRANEEYLCLASCENLTRNGNENSVWNFRDLRQFGTVSENALTTSAISFIESGDRWLHQNGVLNGLEYVSMTTSSFTFRGGIAHIDGSIVNINNFVVYPMNIWRSGIDPDVLLFALCVKKDGTHELLPVWSTSSLADFTSPAATTMQLRIYTIAQIIEERKDLLPIYLLTIGTGTAGLVLASTPIDIRKFITNNEFKDGLVLYNTEKVSGTTMPLGNFKTWEAVSNYVYANRSLQNTIIVKGVTRITSYIDFYGIPVNIIGDGYNEVFCQVDGINLAIGNNMTIRNVNFIRAYGAADGAAQSFVPSKATLGMILTAPNTGTYKNVTIDNCTFATYPGHRKSGVAHILFQKTGDDAVLSNVNITNNQFLETSSQLDIAFVNRIGATATLSNMTSATGFALVDITIDNNKGNSGSWMIIGSDNYYGGSGQDSRGLSGYGIRIKNNHIDYIWHNISRWILDTYDGATFGKSNTSLPALYSDVVIENNTFIGLINRAIDGTLLGSDLTVGAYTYRLCRVAGASMMIRNNRGTSISASCNGDYYSRVFPTIYSHAESPGAIDIHHNMLSSSTFDPIFFDPNDDPSMPGVTNYISYGISVLGNSGRTEEKDKVVNISHNTITNDLLDFNAANKLYNYIAPIYTTVPANINYNIIEKCIAENCNGIWINYSQNPLVGDGYDSFDAVITNNTLHRGGIDVYSYILINGSYLLRRIIVTDNVFDGYTNDDALTDPYLIKYNTSFGYKITTQRNINHQFLVDGFPYINCSEKKDDTQYGWVKSYYGVVSMPLYYISPGVVLDCGNAGGGADLFDPIFISIPNIDGAIPQYISFSMSCSNNVGVGDTSYGVRVYSQAFPTAYNVRTLAPFNSFTSKWVTSMYTVSPATALRNSIFRTHTVTLGTDFINNSYMQSSDNRSQTLIIGICDSDGDYLRIDNAETIYLAHFNIIYRY